MIVEEMARIKLSANAPEGQPIDVQDIRLIDLDSGRYIPADEILLVTDPRGIVSLQTNILLHGVDLRGVALVDGKERTVRLVSNPEDRITGGAFLTVIDCETGKTIRPYNIQFSRRREGKPVFVVGEWRDTSPSEEQTAWVTEMGSGEAL